MSKSIIESNERRDISGFYYDHQKRNPLYRVTLHANSKPPVNKYDPWKSWNETSGVDSSFIYYNETNFDVDSASDEVVKSNTTTKNTKYGAMPLCTSIVNEDFNISIANNWGEFIGSQSVQDLWNNTAKQLEPYSAFAGEQLKKIAEISGSFKDSKGMESFSGKLAKTIGGLASKGGNFLEKSSDVLGRSLVVQGTRFKYYGGTGISFSNLGMKFTLFADYIEEKVTTGTNGVVYTGKYEWKTPDDQLNPILPYAIGEYVSFAGNSNDIEKALNAIEEKSGVKDLESAVNSFFAWQMPPGGFKADVQYIDTQQFGTLMLKIGPYYRLTNLVIQDIQLNYSKHIAKYTVMDGGKCKIKTCPLFCDVFITLTPASKYSNDMLKRFVMSRSTVDDKKKNLGAYYIEKDINDSLFHNKHTKK